MLTGTAAAQLGDDASQAIDLIGRRPHARRVAIAEGRRRSYSRSRGTSAVEFALVGPTAFLLLIGAVVLGIVVTHEVQLTQAVRDSARAAAICGSSTDTTTPSTLPDGTLCTTPNITAYINARVDAVSPTLANHAVITVFDTRGSSSHVAQLLRTGVHRPGVDHLPAAALRPAGWRPRGQLEHQYANHLGAGRGNVRAVNRSRRPGRRTAIGQSLVELALIGPLLLVLIVGGAQVGALVYGGISVATAAQEAARVASEQPINSGRVHRKWNVVRGWPRGDVSDQPTTMSAPPRRRPRGCSTP